MADDNGQVDKSEEIADDKAADIPVEKAEEADVKDDEKPEVAEKNNKEKDNEEKDADESSDEEVLGLFDKGVLMEGKRERKSVPRLSSDSMTPTQPKRGSDLDFTKGKGTKLGNLEWTEYEINRSASDELKPLHRLLYGRDGKTREVKKNIRDFCGFPFGKNDPYFQRKLAALERFTLNGIRRLCEIFNIKKGTRDDMTKDLIGFLMKPEDTGKRVPKSRGDKKSKKAKTPKKKASKTSTEKKSKKTVSEDDNEEDGDKKAGDDDDEEETETKKPTKSPKKAKVKTTPSKEKVEVKKSPSKSHKKKTSTPSKDKKPTKVKLPSKVKAAAKRKADDSDDDEPLVKKAKSGSEPTNEDLKKRIHTILDGADLESITMKIVCKQVAESFPAHDLSPRKKFIKETVKEIIS